MIDLFLYFAIGAAVGVIAYPFLNWIGENPDVPYWLFVLISLTIWPLVILSLSAIPVVRWSRSRH